VRPPHGLVNKAGGPRTPCSRNLAGEVREGTSVASLKGSVFCEFASASPSRPKTLVMRHIRSSMRGQEGNGTTS